MRKFLMGLVAALIATAFMLVGTVPVMAATGSDGDSVTYELNLNISDAASSDSSFDYRSKSIVRSAVNSDGQPVFYPVNHPSAHWRMANAKRCVTLKSYPNAKMIKRLYANPTIFKFRHGSKAETLFRKAAMSDKFVKKGSTDVMSASCFWLRPRTKFPDTVKDITDQVHGVGNSVKGNKPMLFEVAKATTHRSGESADALVPVRRGQDFDGDGVIDDGDCGNKKPAVIEYDEGEYEYNDSDNYWWKDEGDVEARVHVGGSATIRQGNCSMTLNYDFFAQGLAGYSVLVKGKTSIEAHGNAIEIISKQSAHADASANAAASVKANLKAEFTGCDNQPPTYAAPQATAPFVNDVLVNNTRTMTFTGKLAKGTTGFATATAGTGTILGSNRVSLTVDNDGYFSVTYTYKAGAEPGTDTVTLVVDQSDGQSVTVKTKGKDANGQEVEYFQIRAVPPETE